MSVRSPSALSLTQRFLVSSSQQQRQHEVNLNRSNSHLYGGSSGNRNANTAITETIYIGTYLFGTNYALIK